MGAPTDFPEDQDYLTANHVWELRCDEALTKHERFAMAAMQGILSAPWYHPSGEDDTKMLAKSAVDCADALIAELEKGKGE